MANISDTVSARYNDTTVTIFALIVYRGLSIMYLVTGLLCNAILLLAFYKQSKTEKAYGYQVAFTVSQTLEIFCFGTYLAVLAWLDWIDVASWFVSNYWLVFVFEYLGLCSHVILMTGSVLLAVAMAADRVFALTKPIVYRNINHVRHRTIALIACFVVSVAVNSAVWNEAKVVRVEDRYIMCGEDHLLTTTEGILYFSAASITSIISLVILAVLNTLMVTMFKLRMTRSSTVAGDGTNQERVRKRKAAEKFLLWVSIYQTCTMVLNQTVHVVWFTLCIVFPEAAQPYANVLGPVFNGLLMLIDTLDVLVLVGVNKKIRGLVLNVLPCRYRCSWLLILLGTGGVRTSNGAGAAWRGFCLPSMFDYANCTYSDNATFSVHVFRVVIYRGLNFVYLTIGLFGNVMLLTAFYKQSKTEKAYGYQVVFTISKALEILWFGTFLLAITWFDLPDGWPWFNKSYTLMFIFRYLGVTFHLSLINATVLLAVAMAADRVFAMTKPLAYRSINHLRHQCVAYLCCYAIGFLGHGIYLRHFEIFAACDRYIVQINLDLNRSPVGIVFFHLRFWARALGLLSLIVLNVLMVIIFKKHTAKVEAMTSIRSRERKRNIAEKTLLWVNIYQTCVMALNQAPHVTWVTLCYVFPELYSSTAGMIIGPACDAMVMITDTFDSYIVIAINQKMRKLVRSSAPACCRRTGSERADDNTMTELSRPG